MSGAAASFAAAPMRSPLCARPRSLASHAAPLGTPAAAVAGRSPPPGEPLSASRRLLPLRRPSSSRPTTVARVAAPQATAAAASSLSKPNLEAGPAPTAPGGHHEHPTPTLRALLGGGGGDEASAADDGRPAPTASASSLHPDRVIALSGDALDAHLDRIVQDFMRTSSSSSRAGRQGGGSNGGGNGSDDDDARRQGGDGESRPHPVAPRRVMLKVSGEALAGAAGHGVDAGVLDAIAREIRAAVHKGGVQVAVVVGGGNYWRGAESAGVAGIDRPTADHVGMLATVMNSLCLQAALESLGVPARVQSAIEMREVAEPYIRRRAVRHLERGRVVIFGAGTGSPFFSTDTAAALRAAEVGAGVVLKATKVDGVYDRDPSGDAASASSAAAGASSAAAAAGGGGGAGGAAGALLPPPRRYERLSYAQVAERGLGVMDAAAIALCRENGIPVVVFNAFGAGNVLRAALGVEGVGTTVGAVAAADDDE